MNISFPSFANSLQSTQMTGTFNRVASPSMATVGSRSDVLTLSGQRIESFTSVYQRPVTPVGSMLEARFLTQNVSSIEQLLAKQHLEIPPRVSESELDLEYWRRWSEQERGKKSWALGVPSERTGWCSFGWCSVERGLNSGLWGAIPRNYHTRSEAMQTQAMMETTGQILSKQIDYALKASGISLSEKDRLNFSIDQFGKISIDGDLGSANGRKQILEDILNGDDAIRSNLFLYQVQQDAIESRRTGWGRGPESSIEHRMISRAYDWAHGNINGIQEDGIWWIEKRWDTDVGHWVDYQRSDGFPLEFSFQDGKVFQGNDFPEDRVFSDRLDSLADLGKVIGLDESAAKDVQSFISALERNIAVDTPRLTKLLNEALGKAKLGDVKNKITFSLDADGNIVIDGNLKEDQKKRLADLINSDSELSELIKTQSAKQAVLDELKASVMDEPVFNNSPSAWKRHTARPAGFNLSQDSLASAREQLLKNFLDRNGISMSDLKGNLDTLFEEHGELGAIKGLRNEIDRLLAPATKPAPTEPQPLLAMKRGELVEIIGANERLGIDEAVADLRQRLNFWMGEYNKHTEFLMPGHPELMLTGFTVTFDHTGKPSLEVRTADGNSASGIPEAFEKSVPGVPAYLMNVFTYKPGAYQDLALAILDAHDDEHGDVQEYMHSIIIDSGLTSELYRIESPEADQAALQEMEELTQEIGTALGEFFSKTMSIENPFSMIFGSDGLLSLGINSLSSMESRAVERILADINHYLIAKEAGEDTEGMLPDDLMDITPKLEALKNARDKIHDKSLLPKDRFITTTSTV